MTTVRSRVMVVGSIAADLTVFSRRLPRPGETVIGDEFTLVLGGKGANQAIAAGRAGAATSMVGCIGADLFQHLVSAGLADAGVDTAHVRAIDGERTGVAHIRVDASGENDIVVVPLANSRLDAAHVDGAFDALGETVAVLLTQLEIPHETAAHSVHRAKSHGVTVILDPAPAHELPDDVWADVDVVTPNETEATLLTGIPVSGVDTAVAAGRRLLAMGVGAAVITLASAGSVLVTAAEVQFFEPLRVDAVDTTAAGDAFAGYLAAGLATGMPLPDAIRRAGAAGAITVTRRGASPSLPALSQVEALLAR